MYTVSVTAEFSATHRVKMPDGSTEPLHGHDWAVTAFFSHAQLDDLSMVVDFCEAQACLKSLIGRWHHRDLNEHPDFADLIPTAEVVARKIVGDLLASGFDRVRRVDVVEAPGCVASFERPAEAH